MAKRNSDYWKKRFAALEEEQYQYSARYYRDVQKQFQAASNSIQMDIGRWYQRLADNNGISYAGAKKFLKSSELDEFKWSVEQYIKAGEENAVDGRWLKELENASARHHISYLESMKLRTQQHAELLSAQFGGSMADYMKKSYGDDYYHTAFEIAKGTGMGSNLAKLDNRKVDTIIRKPWAQDGANFSDRIWANKGKLVNSLHTELTQNIIRGSSPQQAISSLAKTMEVSRSQAGRLIMTESAAIASTAQKDCFKDLGVEQYEILATLDSLTSRICRDMDGKVFDMKDYKVGETAPPFHPNCRSTTVPYFDDEFTEGDVRAARDEETGKSVYVPANMKYEEWEKHFIAENDGSNSQKANEKLTLEEEGAVIRYVSPDSYVLNDKLRRKESLTDVEKDWIMKLDSALEKLPRHEGNLNRSLTFGYEEDAKKYFDSMLIDEEFVPEQYLSTTKKGIYNDDGQVQIYIQNTKNGKDLGSLNSMEGEVLYPIGSRFKVLNKVEHNGKYVILLEEV